MAEGGIVAQSIRFALGLDFDGKGFGTAENAIAKLQGMAVKLGTGLAGGYLFKQFTDMAYETADTADKLDELTGALNLNAEAYQKLSYAAKLQGVEQETLNGAFGTMYRVASKAALGATGAAQKFTSIGVSVKDAGGNLKSTNELFTETGAAIRGLKSPSEQTAAAIRIFGEGGARLVPLFKLSSEQLAKYGIELEELGGLMDSGFIKDAAEFGDMQDRQRKAFLGVRVALTRAVLPALEAFVKAMTWVAKTFTHVTKYTRSIEAALITLGGYFTFVGVKAAWAGREAILAWLKAAAPILGVVAALALVALAIDDVWTYLEGGDSVFGQLLDNAGPFLTKLADLFVSTATDMGKRAGDALAKGLAESPVFAEIKRIAKAIEDYIVGPLGALTGNKSALGQFSQRLFGSEKVQPAAYANADGSIDYTSNENKAKYSPGPWAAGDAAPPSVGGPQESPWAGMMPEQFTMPGVTAGNTVRNEINNQTTIEIKPVIQGSGLSADQIGQAIGQVVDERMQSHFDDAFSSLVPAAP